MRILTVVLVLFTSLNLTALSNEYSTYSTHNLTENVSNKISDIVNSKPYTRSISTNHTIRTGQKLNVYNLNGSIKLIGWNKNYIQICACKKVFGNCSDLNNIQMTLNTLNGLNIETVNTSNDDCARIDYVIRVPKNTIIGEIFTRGNIKYKNLPNKMRSNIRKLSKR